MNEELVELLGDVITGELVCYTLPANYNQPVGDQSHEDVARRCGPQIAEHVVAALQPYIDQQINNKLEEIASEFECDPESSDYHRRMCPSCSRAEQIRALKEHNVLRLRLPKE